MAKFEVRVKASAEKDLSKIPRPEQQRIASAMSALSANPRPTGCKKLVNAEFWRIRVGQYRVVYSIEDKILVIEVVRIAHRKEVYR